MFDNVDLDLIFEEASKNTDMEYAKVFFASIGTDVEEFADYFLEDTQYRENVLRDDGDEFIMFHDDYRGVKVKLTVTKHGGDITLTFTWAGYDPLDHPELF